METNLRVELLSHTPEPEKLIAQAARLCYSPEKIEDILKNKSKEDNENFVSMLMNIGHSSPLEHCSLTFGIEGVSRALTHQLVRHRIASYSQKSQRYVKESQFEYVIPEKIIENENATLMFENAMHFAQETYDSIVEELISDGYEEKEAIEEARYVMPNAAETKIILTMNIRSLLNFFEHRLCFRAQSEIRHLAVAMLKLSREVLPIIFYDIGKPCIMKGYCPEGKMQCKELKGKIPAK